MAKELDFSMFDDEVETQEQSEDSLDMSMFDEDSPVETPEGPSIEPTAPDEMSLPEVLGRGGLQGLTLDFGDEALGAVESAWDIATGDPEISDFPELYKENTDEQRKRMKQAADENPVAYYGADVASGIVPALFSGGATAVAGVGKALAKGAGKATMGKALGKAALKGTGYGAVTGAGASEAEDLEGVAKDAAYGGALGGTMGAALPVLGKAAMKGLDSTGSLIKGAANLIPGSEAIGLGYKAGKKGLGISKDEIIDESIRVSKELEKKVKSVLESSGVDRDKAIKMADEAGVRINAGESIDEVLAKIVDDGAIGLEAKSRNKLYKDISSLKKGFDEQQELMKLESKAANDAVKESRKYGSEVESVSEINTNYEDAIPLPDAKGKVKGLETKYSLKTPEGVEEYRKILTKPLDESIVKKIEYDVDDMAPSEAKSVLDYINNNLVGDVTKSPSVNEKYARKLALKIREKLDDSVEEFADPTGSMAKIYQGMKKLGVKNAGDRGEYKVNEIVDSASKKILATGDAADIDKRRAFEYLKQASPEMEDIVEEAAFTSRLNSKLGSSSEGVNTTSVKGLAGSAEGLAAKTSNLVGKGVNAVSGYAKPVINATSNVVNKVSDMSDDALIKASSKMIDSGNSGAKVLGQQLQYAMQQEGPIKNALLWSLSQQPAFRSLINKEEKQYSEAINIEPNYLGREPQGMVEDSISIGDSALMRDEDNIEDDLRTPTDVRQEGMFGKMEQDQTDQEMIDKLSFKDAFDSHYEKVKDSPLEERPDLKWQGGEYKAEKENESTNFFNPQNKSVNMNVDQNLLDKVRDISKGLGYDSMTVSSGRRDVESTMNLLEEKKKKFGLDSFSEQDQKLIDKLILRGDSPDNIEYSNREDVNKVISENFPKEKDDIIEKFRKLRLEFGGLQSPHLQGKKIDIPYSQFVKEYGKEEGIKKAKELIEKLKENKLKVIDEPNAGIDGVIDIQAKLEKLQKDINSHGRYVSSGGSAMESSTADRLMGSIDDIEIPEEEKDNMKQAAMDGNIPYLREMINKYKNIS